MKVLISFTVMILSIVSANADYYRASGGGVYELYVTDCSASGMRRALDNAVATRHAVITSVKCAASDRNSQPITSDIYMETIDAEFLCPCALVAFPCGC